MRTMYKGKSGVHRKRSKEPKTKFRYAYDLGDGWDHEIVIEKTMRLPAREEARITCLKGARACPPEDCGGVGGYARALAAREDESEAIEEELAFRESFAPEHFNIYEVNDRLAAYVRWSRPRALPE